MKVRDEDGDPGCGGSPRLGWKSRMRREIQAAEGSSVRVKIQGAEGVLG